MVFKYGLTSLLDAPCGAATNSWMKQVANSLHNNVTFPLSQSTNNTSFLISIYYLINNTIYIIIIISQSTQIPCFRYHGVDVVEDVIRRNKMNFSTDTSSPSSQTSQSSWYAFSVKDLSGGSSGSGSGSSSSVLVLVLVLCMMYIVCLFCLLLNHS